VSLATTVETPSLNPIYTLELTGKVLLKGWLVYSANAYSLACGYSFFGVQWNGVALVPQSSIAIVEANDGSYFQDAAGVVYVNPPTGGNIYTETVQGGVLYTFSKGPNKIFDSKATTSRSSRPNCYFESRVATIPQLSLRIEPRFSGVGQVGGGTCELINADGFFDSKTDIDWDRASFFVGADTDSTTMIYSDYQPLGSYRVENWQANRSRFILTLIEVKTVLNQKIPIETFTRAAYPNISQNEIGKIIPRIYGRVFAVVPICVDATLKRFKICGHAVYEISEARIKQDNVWVSVPMASRDEANGEFTLGAEWTDNQDVCCDVVGVKNVDGSPMWNWSDVVKDILTYLGETDFDTASFTAARSFLVVGQFVTGPWYENTLLKASLWIDSATTALDLISRINNTAGSFLYVDASGLWHYEIFKAKALGDVVATYADSDILLNSFSKLEETRDVYSKVSINFAKRNVEEWSQNVVFERGENQRRVMSGTAILKEIDAPLFDEHDANYYGQRILTTDGEPLTRFTFSVKWRGLLRKPGEQIAVNFAAQGIAGVFEILEVRPDLDQNRVTLVCGDRRAWADSFGWWVSDAVAAWSAGATSDAKRIASESSGFWHGTDDLADSTDSKSYATSRFF
jgi:hypothetical protein